jgi:hypothetical protein
MLETVVKLNGGMVLIISSPSGFMFSQAYTSSFKSLPYNDGFPLS